MAAWTARAAAPRIAAPRINDHDGVVAGERTKAQPPGESTSNIGGRAVVCRVSCAVVVRVGHGFGTVAGAGLTGDGLLGGVEDVDGGHDNLEAVEQADEHDRPSRTTRWSAATTNRNGPSLMPAPPRRPAPIRVLPGVQAAADLIELFPQPGEPVAAAHRGAPGRRRERDGDE